jgi:hypothetical protein
VLLVTRSQRILDYSQGESRSGATGNDEQGVHSGQLLGIDAAVRPIQQDADTGIWVLLGQCCKTRGETRMGLDIEGHFGRMTTSFSFMGDRRDGEGMSSQAVYAESQKAEKDVLAWRPGDDGWDPDLDQSARKDVKGGGMETVKEICPNPCVEERKYIDTTGCDEVVPIKYPILVTGDF